MAKGISQGASAHAWRMAQRKYGGRGNRNPDRKAYDGHARPHQTRPLPDDFRERYLEMGWEAQWYYSTNWRVMCRWIDEAGGQELIDARARWLRENGNNQFHGYR